MTFQMEGAREREKMKLEMAARLITVVIDFRGKVHLKGRNLISSGREATFRDILMQKYAIISPH